MSWRRCDPDPWDTECLASTLLLVAWFKLPRKPSITLKELTKHTTVENFTLTTHETIKRIT
jgi:hypothetical protein